MRQVLLLSVLFLSLYAVFTALFRLSHLDELADELTIAIARGTLSTLTGAAVSSKIEENVVWFQVRETATIPATDILESKDRARFRRQGKIVDDMVIDAPIVSDRAVNRENVNANLPMFLAVVVALAAQRRGRMLLVLAAGCAFLVLIDGLSLASIIWQAPNNRLPEDAAYHVLKMVSVWVEGGWLMAPIFIGALVALTWLSPEGVAFGKEAFSPDKEAAE